MPEWSADAGRRWDPILRVQDLEHRYPGAPGPVLRGLDFEIRSGEVFGFLGPNASGKTSLLEALAYLGRGKSFRGASTANLIQHGAQEFVFERPLVAGDVLTGEPGETRTYEKRGRRGGLMRFVEFETIYLDQRGEIALRSRTTAIQTEGVVEGS